MPYVRFAVSMFVLLFHASLAAPARLDAISPFFAKGWIGTDFFILLSGFVISYSYTQRFADGSLTPDRFMLGRFLRIWPPHAVVLAGFMLYFLLLNLAGITINEAGFFDLNKFFSQFFLLNAIIYTEHGWNVPTWTLSALMVCYFLFALSARRISSLNDPLSITLLMIGIALASFAGSIFLLGQNFLQLHTELAILRAIPLFVIGVLLGRLYVLGGAIEKIRFLSVTNISFALIILTAHLWSGVLHDAVILLLLCVSLLSIDIKAPSSQFVHALGRSSFAIYLLHVPLMYVYFPFLEKIVGLQRDGTAYWLLWLAFPLLVVVAAYVFERLIESRLANWGRAIAKRDKGGVNPGPAGSG